MGHKARVKLVATASPALARWAPLEGRGRLGWAGVPRPGSAPAVGPGCSAGPRVGTKRPLFPGSRLPGLPGQPGPEAALTWREPGHGEGWAGPGRAGLPASSSVAAEWPDAAAFSSRPPSPASAPPRLVWGSGPPASATSASDTQFPVGGAKRAPRPPPRSQCQTSQRAQETKVAFSPPGCQPGSQRHSLLAARPPVAEAQATPARSGDGQTTVAGDQDTRGPV